MGTATSVTSDEIAKQKTVDWLLTQDDIGEAFDSLEPELQRIVVDEWQSRFDSFLQVAGLIVKRRSPDDVFDLADHVKMLDDTQKAMSSTKSMLEEAYKDAKRQLAELMLADEIDGFKRNGKTFFLTTEFYASVTKDNRPAFHEYLRSNGHGDMIDEAVHASKLKSFVKELVDESETDELPDELKDIVTTSSSPIAGMRKA